MRNYQVKIQEVQKTEVYIDAENEVEAIEKVFDGQGDYGKSDYQYTLEEGQIEVEYEKDGKFVKNFFVKDGNSWKPFKKRIEAIEFCDE